MDMYNVSCRIIDTDGAVMANISTDTGVKTRYYRGNDMPVKFRYSGQLTCMSVFYNKEFLGPFPIDNRLNYCSDSGYQCKCTSVA